jgi:hypothetical protein
VQLIVTLDSPADALPPATYAFPAHAGGGEVEHPLPLEDKPYDVRASAADGRGDVSGQAVAELPWPLD